MRKGIQLGIWIILGGMITLLSTLPVTWAMPAQKLGRSTMPTRTPEVGVIATMTPEAAGQAQLQLPEATLLPDATATASGATSSDTQPPAENPVTIPTPVEVARGEGQPAAPAAAPDDQATPTAIRVNPAEASAGDVAPTGDSALAPPAVQSQTDASFYIPASQVFTLRRTLGLGLLIIGSIVVVLAITRH